MATHLNFLPEWVYKNAAYWLYLSNQLESDLIKKRNKAKVNQTTRSNGPMMSGASLVAALLNRR